MSNLRQENSEPLAWFLIGRELGVGYRVLSGDGPSFERLKGPALALLDKLGQTDSNGPELTYRRLGPIGQDDEYVFVTISLLPNGEATFQQAWFKDHSKPSSKARFFGPAVVSTLAAFAIIISSICLILLCICLGWLQLAGKEDKRTPIVIKPSDLESPLAIKLDKINTNLNKINTDEVQELRKKLKDFISHKGFLPGDGEVKTQKNSLMIVSVLDTPSEEPKPAKITLTNFEVEKFLLVLKTLDDLSIKETGKSNPSGKD